MEKAQGIHYKWLVLLTVSIGTFMGTLDASIVTISLPRLTTVFNTEPSIVLWVSVVYLLVSVGLMLPLGRWGDVLGRKRIYILGFALFTVGLILCSLSQSIFQLILARIIQGIGAAMTIALSIAIVTAVFSNEERGKALGILGSVVSAGLLTGPVFGGLLLDTLDWRAVFYIRIPIGIIGLVMAWIFLKEQKESVVGFKFDIWGTVMLFGSLSSLLLFFNLSGKMGFLSPLVLILGVSAILLLAFFIVFEKRVAYPIVDLKLFENRLFAGGNISLGIMFLAQAGIIFLMPFYLIQGMGHSASRAGLLIAIPSVTMLLLAPLSGWLSDKIGSRLLCTLGVALVCLALLLLSGLNIESSDAEMSFKLVILGLGLGLFGSPNNSSIMGSVPRDRLGTASAMIATVRQTGMSSGIAIAGTIFTSRQIFHTSHLANDTLNPIMLQKLSLVSSFHDTLIIAAIVGTIAIFTSLARGGYKPS